MKVWIYLAVAGCVLAVTAAVWVGRSPASTPQTPAAQPHGSIYGVDEFMKMGTRLGTNGTVDGVARGPSPQAHSFGLIGAAEVQKCGTTTCAELVLPVRWNGSLPAEGELVRVEGQVQSDGGKLIFVAATLSKQGHGGGAAK